MNDDIIYYENYYALYLGARNENHTPVRKSVIPNLHCNAKREHSPRIMHYCIILGATLIGGLLGQGQGKLAAGTTTGSPTFAGVGGGPPLTIASLAWSEGSRKEEGALRHGGKAAEL